MEDVERVPAGVLAWPASSAMRAASARTARAVGSRRRARADDDHRMLGFAEDVGEAVLALGDLLRACPGRRRDIRRGRSDRRARRRGRCRRRPGASACGCGAFSTAASTRGLVPTSRIASACSMPSMRRVEEVARAAERRVELARRPAGNRGCATPSRTSSRFSANISSAPARSPAMAPIRSGCAAFSLPATAASASSQVAGSSRPLSRI